MLTVHALSKSYGIETIFHDVTFNLNAGERLGLVGPNGCGKTTLLRILAGQEHLDSGSYHFSPPGLRLGYLPQGLSPAPGETLADFLDCQTGELLTTGARLEQLAAGLAASSQDPGLQQAYDVALAQHRHQVIQLDEIWAVKTGNDQQDGEDDVNAVVFV